MNGSTKAQADALAPRVLASLRSGDLMTVSRRQQVFTGAVLNVLVKEFNITPNTTVEEDMERLLK